MFICGAEVYAIFFFMIKATCSPYYQEAKFIRSQAHCYSVRVPTGAPSAHVNRSLGSAVLGAGRGRGLPMAPTGGGRADWRPGSSWREWGCLSSLPTGQAGARYSLNLWATEGGLGPGVPCGWAHGPVHRLESGPVPFVLGPNCPAPRNITPRRADNTLLQKMDPTQPLRHAAPSLPLGTAPSLHAAAGGSLVCQRDCPPRPSGAPPRALQWGVLPPAV